MKWISRKVQECPKYEWVLLGFPVEEYIGEQGGECASLSWQIGRMYPGKGLEFFTEVHQYGPYQGDSFWTWNAEQATHWMEINAEIVNKEVVVLVENPTPLIDKMVENPGDK